MALYLIKRRPRPEYHKAPYHEVIVCDRKPIAWWEAGWTGDRSWVWTKEGSGPDYAWSGWLLERWEGLDLDYGGLVRGGVLPDGTTMGVHHRQAVPETWALLRGAVWWSTKRLPSWLADLGVVEAEDAFTRGRIEEEERDDELPRLMRASRR